jgi:hypothetical protein
MSRRPHARIPAVLGVTLNGLGFPVTPVPETGPLAIAITGPIPVSPSRTRARSRSASAAVGYGFVLDPARS